MKIKKNFTNALLIGFILGILGYLIISVVPLYYEEHNVTAKVLDKNRVYKDQSSYYLIYTDNETFAIRDSFIKGQYYSSDLYGKIEIGKTYTFSVYGFRNGFFSMYRNINKYEEV